MMRRAEQTWEERTREAEDDAGAGEAEEDGAGDLEQAFRERDFGRERHVGIELPGLIEVMGLC